MIRPVAFVLGLLLTISTLTWGQVAPKVWAGKYLYPNIVDSGDIADVSRSLDLPLASFYAGDVLLTATTQPNATLEAGIGPCIEWASGENGATYAVSTTFWVHEDCVAAHSVMLLCRSTQSATATDTAFDYDFFVNGHAAIDATATNNAAVALVQPATSGCTAIVSLPISPQDGLSPGRVVTLRLWRTTGQGTLRVFAVRFQYTANR